MTHLAARISLIASLLFVVASCGGPATVSYTSAAPSAAALSSTFDADAAGSPPPGSEVFSGQWAVRAESDAPSKPNALCQTASAEFPAIALTSTVYADVVVSIRFKAISGKEDQAAGIIFRVQDKGSYYILRANALEGNVVFFKYASANRTSMKEGSAKVVAGQWQELRVEVTGDRMRGFLNGQLVVETTDTAYKAGRVGLWTKADSVTCFDDVSVRPG